MSLLKLPYLEKDSYSKEEMNDIIAQINSSFDSIKNGTFYDSGGNPIATKIGMRSINEQNLPEEIVTTTKIGNQSVTTIKIVDASIVSIAGTYTNAGVSCPVGTRTLIQSVSLEVTGLAIWLDFMFYYDGGACNFHCDLYRDGAPIFDSADIAYGSGLKLNFSFFFLDTPSQGTVVYNLYAYPTGTAGGTANRRYLMASEIKK